MVNVQARVVRASYGVMLNESWCEEEHNSDDKYYSEDWQEWMAQDQMSWFLNIVRLVKKGVGEWGKEGQQC